jgi:hypothetical protein
MYRPTTAYVCPSFFKSARDIVEFVSAFGPWTGRYTAASARSWMNAFKEHLDSLTDIDRTRAVSRLDRVLDCLHPHTILTRLSSEPSWRLEADTLAASKNSGIEYFVGSSLEESPYPIWDKIYDKIIDPANDRKEWKISGTPDDYVAMMKPFILKAPFCLLVDPYFEILSDHLLDGTSHHRPHKEMIIQKLLIIAAEEKSNAKCFDLHVVSKIEKDLMRSFYDHASIKDALTESLSNRFSGFLRPKGKLIFHGVTPKQIRLHRRLLLSELGGIAFENSLNQPKQEYRDPNTGTFLCLPGLRDEQHKYWPLLSEPNLNRKVSSGEPLLPLRITITSSRPQR